MSATLLTGDCVQVMQGMPERSVQCVVTSPPYWGLRDYGVAGQLGLEPTPESYVSNMVAVFREVRRVLRDDGVLWLNIGDSYAQSEQRHRNGKSGSTMHCTEADQWNVGTRQTGRRLQHGLKPKDLVGIPWRVAFALQADGWWLRSDCIWHKPNPMPESVTDRPTRSHEYLFLLTKSDRYYYDAQAITEPASDATTRNARSVWTIATQPYKGAHFATFPKKLATRCVLAGSSTKACEHCGAPWEAEYSRGVGPREVAASEIDRYGTGEAGVHRKVGGQYQKWMDAHPKKPVGSSPTCSCENDGTGRSAVLDPFGGSGTVAQVATELGRDSIYIDLNPDYMTLARKRVADAQPQLAPAA